MTCCLCSNPEAVHTERRPSGGNGELEAWAFCSQCWQEVSRQRADHDPFVLTRFVIFLQYLHGGYRMQRDSPGNQAAKVMPGKKKIDEVTY